MSKGMEAEARAPIALEWHDNVYSEREIKGMVDECRILWGQKAAEELAEKLRYSVH